MRLRRLKLENFRQHLDTEIEFADGMTAIVGPNGSGKSTILEAIGYALYSENRANKDQIPSYWQENKKYSVTLEFELDERTYRVFRTESKAGLEENISGIWEERAEGPRSVTKQIETLLGLTYSRFINSFCALQKELEFLKLGAANRRDEIAKMLGFDDLRLAEERAKTAVGTLRAELTGTVSNTPQDPQAILREEADKQAQRQELEARLHGLEAELAAGKEALPAAEEKALNAQKYMRLYAEFKELQQKGRSLQERLGENKESLTRLETEAKSHAELAPLAEHFQQVEGKLSDCEKAQQAYQSQMASEVERLAEIKQIENRLDNLKTPSLKVAQEQLQELLVRDVAHKQKVVQARTKRDEVQAKTATAKAEAEAAIRKFAHSESLLKNGKCPECGQTFTGDFQVRLDTELAEKNGAQFNLKSQEAALAKARADLEGLEAVTFDEAIADAQELVRKATEAEALQQRKSLLVTSSTHLGNLTPYDAEAHSRLKAQLLELKPDYERFLALSKVPEQLQRAQEALAIAQSDFETAKEAATLIKAQRSELGFTDDQEAQLANDLAVALKAKLQNLQQLQSDQKRDLERTLQDVRAIEVRKIQLLEHETRKLILEKKIALYVEAQKQLKALREHLNRQLQPLIKERAERNLSELTGGRYTALELDDKFEAAVVEDGKPKGVISGGEEDVLALSLRLALSQLIQERQGRAMGLLILDEVFGSLDHDRRESVLECLENLKGLSGSFGQIFIISHIADINQVADQCFYLSLDTVNHSTTVSDQPTGADLVLPEGLKTGLFAS
jgi:exonuclease SbcC